MSLVLIFVSLLQTTLSSSDETLQVNKVETVAVRRLTWDSYILQLQTACCLNCMLLREVSSNGKLLCECFLLYPIKEV